MKRAYGWIRKNPYGWAGRPVYGNPGTDRYKGWNAEPENDYVAPTAEELERLIPNAKLREALAAIARNG